MCNKVLLKVHTKFKYLGNEYVFQHKITYEKNLRLRNTKKPN